MAVVGKQRAAKNSRVQVGATNLRHASWRLTWRGDDLDTTNFESAGNEQGTIGVIVGDWQTSGDWDASLPAYADPPGLYPRDDLGQMKFFENTSDGVAHTVAASRVLSAENGAEIRGKVSFSASGKSQGVSMLAAVPTTPI
jgi:hypothetical protein